MYVGLHVMYPLFLSVFNENCIFSTDFRKKNIQISSFMKIYSVGGHCMHVGGQTDGWRDGQIEREA